jgi:hypothetical protein
VDLKEGDYVEDLRIGYYSNESERDPLEELVLDSSGSGWGETAGFCEDGNEPSDCVKCR